MKFNCSVEINKGLEGTVNIWKDPENLVKWQDGFKSITHLSGEIEAVGSKYRFLYSNKGKEFELIETILVNDLP